jgi:hypothetical protein
MRRDEAYSGNISLLIQALEALVPMRSNTPNSLDTIRLLLVHVPACLRKHQRQYGDEQRRSLSQLIAVLWRLWASPMWASPRC